MPNEIQHVPNSGKREFGKYMAYGGLGTLGFTGLAALIPFISPVGLAVILFFAGMVMLAKY